LKPFSVVIPVFNEQESLSQLHGELQAVAKEHGYQLQIIFVDDGSSDGSWEVIQRLAESDSSRTTTGIRLRRNFGKASALAAGIQASQTDLLLTMDADLQDDPHEIPRFLALIEAGADCVSGWKKIRHDPWHKTLPSRLFNWSVSRLTGVRLHDHNCGFKCYRRAIFEDVDLYGERHRFIPVLASSWGWKIEEVVVQHRPRKFGRSKYGWARLPKGLLDLITIYFLTGYQNRPQHLLGSLGIVSFLLGFFGLGVMAVYWIARMVYLQMDWDASDWPPLHQRPVVIYSLGALLLGAQLISIGFLAELITAHYRRGSRSFSIRETTRPGDE
jgi:glycosyltransferase involved in cell wall biosynthesis